MAPRTRPTRDALVRKVEHAVKVQYGYRQSSMLIKHVTYSLPHPVVLKLLRAERAAWRRAVRKLMKPYNAHHREVYLNGYNKACDDLLATGRGR